MYSRLMYRRITSWQVARGQKLIVAQVEEEAAGAAAATTTTAKTTAATEKDEHTTKHKTSVGLSLDMTVLEG